MNDTTDAKDRTAKLAAFRSPHTIVAVDEPHELFGTIHRCASCGIRVHWITRRYIHDGDEITELLQEEYGGSFGQQSGSRRAMTWRLRPQPIRVHRLRSDGYVWTAARIPRLSTSRATPMTTDIHAPERVPLVELVIEDTDGYVVTADIPCRLCEEGDIVPHNPSPRCESGSHPHCTCDRCFR